MRVLLQMYIYYTYNIYNICVCIYTIIDDESHVNHQIVIPNIVSA